MRVFIVVSALLSSALAQYIDPLVGLLSPQQPNLYTIRGPIYVEPNGLQPYGPYGPSPNYAVGPAVVGPPIVGPPVVGPPVMGPAVVGPPIYGQSVVSPSPYNPYAPGYPVQMLYDEQQDEVSPSGRRSNTNVQTGVQQLGQGNMNLQGNIQQVNRRSILGDQMQSDQLQDSINPRGALNDAILASRQNVLQDQLARNLQNDQIARKNSLQDQIMLRNQLQNDPSLAYRQNALSDPLLAMRQQNPLNDPLLALRQQNSMNDPMLARQNTLQDQLMRSQLLSDPSLAYRQQNSMNDPMLSRQQSLNDMLARNQLQNDPLSLIRQQAANDQLRYRNDIELKDQLSGLQSDPRSIARQFQAARYAGRSLNQNRRAPGFQIQGMGLQAQFPESTMNVFSDFPQKDALRSQKGFQNDGTLFDESLLMNDELNDQLQDELNDALPRQQLLSDALSAELADELSVGYGA